MNEQQVLQNVATKLLERWKMVKVEGQKALEAQNEVKENIYQQERVFLEQLLDELNGSLTTPLAEWESYKNHPAPKIYFSPDSTDVEPQF